MRLNGTQGEDGENDGQGGFLGDPEPDAPELDADGNPVEQGEPEGDPQGQSDAGTIVYAAGTETPLNRDPETGQFWGYAEDGETVLDYDERGNLIEPEPEPVRPVVTAKPKPAAQPQPAPVVRIAPGSVPQYVAYDPSAEERQRLADLQLTDPFAAAQEIAQGMDRQRKSEQAITTFHIRHIEKAHPEFYRVNAHAVQTALENLPPPQRQLPAASTYAVAMAIFEDAMQNEGDLVGAMERAVKLMKNGAPAPAAPTPKRPTAQPLPPSMRTPGGGVAKPSGASAARPGGSAGMPSDVRTLMRELGMSEYEARQTLQAEVNRKQQYR